VDFEEMAAKQHHCLETQRLLSSTSLKLAFRQTGAQRLAGDVSTGTFCPIVPLKFRKAIFDHFHNFAHPGRLASRRIISSRFVWRGLSSDRMGPRVSGLPEGKIHRHTCLAPQPISTPQQCFSHLHVDWVDPLQSVIILIVLSPSLIIHPNKEKLFPLLCVHGGMRKGFNLYLDFPFWRSRNDHLQSRPAMYFKPLV
jgi:hypothetical protein